MMRHLPQSRTAVQAKAAKDDRARRVRQAVVAFAAASALALCTLAMARADETWVTVNPDGTVTRSTTTTIQPSPSPAVPNITVQVAPQVPNTTFFPGTYYPVPQYYPHYSTPRYPAPPLYTYQTPGGITYPIGPPIPGFHSPTITTLPSTGVAYGYPGYPHPGYPPYPAYSYPSPYPLYGTTGTYYSGPAGGGGTITSSTSTSNNGISIGYGKRGWKFNVGHGLNTSNSTTTVTTSR